MRYQVISPDGCLIAPRSYPSKTKAEAALTEWCKRYIAYGYYASVHGRIPLADLPSHCTIKATK